MADDSLLTAAGRIADGEHIDWASITSTLPSEEDRAIAEELAVVAQIAAGHRQLHQLLPVAADTPPNLVPDRARWGHLDLLNIVGRGSYGTVYRAWDTRLERLVALKLFHGASNPDAVMQEGRMLARIRHENVVSVYGADVIDGVAGIWMELVHGRTLDNLVKDSGPLRRARSGGGRAPTSRDALAAVHAAGLLHCDVKAQNVVRESGGRVVLMDFGAGRLAPETRDSDQMSDVAGTPRYMAPELFEAGRHRDQRRRHLQSSACCCISSCLRRFPVDGKTLGELRRAHQEGKTARARRSLSRATGRFRRAGLEGASIAIRRSGPSRQRDSASRASPRWRASRCSRTPTRLGLVVGRDPDARRVALAALLWSTRSSTPAAALPPPNTLAVLPITNLTGDPSKQYLADGLTEVSIAHLAQRARPATSLRQPAIATLRSIGRRRQGDRREARRAIAARRIGAAGQRPHSRSASG